MFIELTRAKDGTKQQIPLDGISYWTPKAGGGSDVHLNDTHRPNIGVMFSCNESPAAIRSALLKAGLLVVVEKEGEAQHPVPTPNNLEGRSLESLMKEYAVNESNGLLTKELRDSLQSSIIAELQRRIDAKPEQVVRLDLSGKADSWFVDCEEIQLTDVRATKNEAIEDALRIVRAIAGPNVRIEWEDET